MAHDRRSFLKMLTMTSAHLYATRFMGLSPMSDIQDTLPSGADVNLVFHGFFFFDFQGDALVVGSPFYKDHLFMYRDHAEDELHDMPEEVVSYEDQLIQGSVCWSDAIMSLSKSQASISGPVIPRQYSSDRLGSLLVLPYPKKVVPIRFGGLTDEFELEGTIAQYIKLPSDKKCGLATCLQYDKKNKSGEPDFDARHYYAEHCIPPGNEGLKQIFTAARNGFGGTFKDKFDLKMTQTKQLSPDSAKLHEESKRSMARLDDDDYNDEAALRELRYVKHNPCKPFETPADRFAGRAGRMHGTIGRDRDPRLIRTANCPQFGILP
ncbi:MAG TPA: hypothetical protein VF532_08375 [Candidatus Angelobacter sp.]